MTSNDLEQTANNLTKEGNSLAKWLASLTKNQEFLEKELEQIMNESREELDQRVEQEDQTESASVILEYEIDKAGYREHELNKFIQVLEEKTINLPSGLFKKLSQNRRQTKLIIPKFVEEYHQNQIILQRNYDKKSKELAEMEEEITKEMRWTAAFSAKIKTKRKMLSRAKKRFIKLCKRHGFNPQEAESIKIPGDVSESEINVEEFNNIEVEQELEEEEKQRKIREEEFLKQIRQQQKEFIPGFKEESLLPEPQKSVGQQKKDVRIDPAQKAMKEVKRVEEKKQCSEDEIDPDEIMENYMRKKLKKQAQNGGENVIKMCTIKTTTVKLKAGGPLKLSAPPL